MRKRRAELTPRNEMGRAIPFGQPILVGHHSEGARPELPGAHRHRTMTRASPRAIKAERLRERAASVGKGGVSSDDPSAVERSWRGNASRPLESSRSDVHEALQRRDAEAQEGRRPPHSPSVADPGGSPLAEATRDRNCSSPNNCGRVGFPGQP